MDAIRGMLDELMGKARDAPLHERSVKQINFYDPDVCKHELTSVCPNQLFKNTRSDLGACGFGIHADHLDWPEIKAAWDKLDEREKERYGYERDLVRYMEQLIREMDRKIEKNKERAAAESRPKPVRPDDQRKLDEIKARMDECLERSQEMGEAGDVDGSMATMQQAEVYKRQHEVLFKQLTAPDRSMTVCEICGVFINSTDNDQRRLDHLTGKQYLGWKKIREVYAELVEKRKALPPGGPHGSSERSRSRGGDEPGERPGSRGERDRDRDRERDRERDRGRGGGDERRRERSRSPRRREYERGGRDHYDRDRRDYYERDRRDYDRGHYDRRDYGRDRRY